MADASLWNGIAAADAPQQAPGLYDKLMQTWPVRAAQGLWQGLTLPGDVYQGNVSMYGPDGHVNPEVIDRSADLAGGVTLGAGAIPAEADALRAGIKAYHASPYSFDRFDMSKVGSGEGKFYPDLVGKQGMGMYFTENPELAEAYRDMFKLEAKGKGKSSAAHVYETELKTNPSDLLDLSSVPGDARTKALAEEFGLRPDATGHEIYQTAGTFPGRGFDPALATDVLKDAGYKGTTYLDHDMSDVPSRNYVVFDDKLIDILKKYGLTGLLGAGAGLSGMGAESEQRQ